MGENARSCGFIVGPARHACQPVLAYVSKLFTVSRCMTSTEPITVERMRRLSRLLRRVVAVPFCQARIDSCEADA